MYQIGDKVIESKGRRKGQRPIIGEAEIVARYPAQVKGVTQYGYELEDERGFSHSRVESQLRKAV